jgi:23S rRNA pseudouridine955/2504/2580 synthase
MTARTPGSGSGIVAVIIKSLKPHGKSLERSAAAGTGAARDPDPIESAPAARQVVVQDSDGQRIDNFLVRELKGLPKSRIYRMLRTGEVRVNGGRVKPAHRLTQGDRVRIPPLFGMADPSQRAEAEAAFIHTGVLERLERAILYEDDELIVVDKPAGLAVHGGSGVSFGAIEALRRLRPALDLQLAHRLDRDTSGCLLVAKSRAPLLELHRALRERTVRKRYDVLVHGAWPARRTSVQLPLERFLLASGERRVRVAEAGKAARTDFAVREFGTDATWLEARLHTGRTHQIRVHAQASGHPVIGDAKYADARLQALAADRGVQRLCLHATELVIHHRGSRLRLEAPLPADFQSAWRAFA